MMTIAVDFAVNITGLLFLIFMMVVYFSKKNMNNIDNMLFKLLLLFNFLNSFIHIFFLLFQWYQIRNDALLLVIIRGYWIPIQCYIVVMAFYLLFALKGSDPDFNNKLLANKKKFYIYLWGSLGIITIIFTFCPISLVYDNSGILAGMTGFATILFYLFLIIFYLMVLVSLVIFRKKNTKEKILPFKVLAIFLTAGFILSAMYPQLCVTEFLITILSYLMFHTIENPDLKLVNQLTLAKNEAEKASNAKSEFLSSMSHELRTPLNAIVGLSTMIKEEQTREEINRDADDILKASNNLLELVDGILDINKLESNNMEIVSSSYNPKELFDSIEKSTKIRIGDKPIEYRSRISEDLPTYLMGDKNKLKTIINNLLSNAVKYTEKGHIDFTVDCINNEDKCNLRITISDTGRGIRNDQKEFLFTKFYRLEVDKYSDIEGTGLGLAITKSLVELMNGEINVNSTEGMGTTFMVTLNQGLIDSSSKVEETEVL